jgi:hypothetical protein
MAKGQEHCRTSASLRLGLAGTVELESRLTLKVQSHPLRKRIYAAKEGGS